MLNQHFSHSTKIDAIVQLHEKFKNIFKYGFQRLKVTMGVD